MSHEHIPILVPRLGKPLYVTVLGLPVHSEEHFDGDKGFYLCHANVLLRDLDLGPCPACPDPGRRVKCYLPVWNWISKDVRQRAIVNVPEGTLLPFEEDFANVPFNAVITRHHSRNGPVVMEGHGGVDLKGKKLGCVDVIQTLSLVWGVSELLKHAQARQAKEVHGEIAMDQESTDNQDRPKKTFGKKGSPEARR